MSAPELFVLRLWVDLKVLGCFVLSVNEKKKLFLIFIIMGSITNKNELCMITKFVVHYLIVSFDPLSRSEKFNVRF